MKPPILLHPPPGTGPWRHHQRLEGSFQGCQTMEPFKPSSKGWLQGIQMQACVFEEHLAVDTFRYSLYQIFKLKKDLQDFWDLHFLESKALKFAETVWNSSLVDSSPCFTHNLYLQTLWAPVHPNLSWRSLSFRWLSFLAGYSGPSWKITEIIKWFAMIS